MLCWRVGTSRSAIAGPDPTSPAGSRIGSTPGLANGSTRFDAASCRRNEKEGRPMRPSYLQGLTARKSGAEAIERRGCRVVVRHIGPVTQAVPNPGPVDDAAGPNLAYDHDPLARRNDPHGAIPGAGSGALADDIGGAKWMTHRHCRTPWREHHQQGHCAHEVDVATCLRPALPVP